MENKNSLRTLYIVQLLTIVVLILLLIQQILPFFGILPIGKRMPQLPLDLPPGKPIQSGSYVSPSNQQKHKLDSASLARALRPHIVVESHL